MLSTELTEIKANFGGFQKAWARYLLSYTSPLARYLWMKSLQKPPSPKVPLAPVSALLGHRQTKLGDCKDYYLAEDDFYKVIHSILRGRDSRAIDPVGTTLVDLQASPNHARSEEWDFAENRVAEMKSFFDNPDNLVRVITALVVTTISGSLKK